MAADDALTVRLATRASALARRQTALVAAALAQQGVAVQTVAVSTRGDEITDRPLADVGGKALFIKGLQDAIAEGRADAAVHSLKDMEAQPTPGFALAAVGFAADCRDVAVCRGGGGLDALPDGARVGTCSPRRAALLARHHPRLQTLPMRGNLQTRLAKLDAGDVDALLLAAAGLERLELTAVIGERLSPAQFIPAAGQGLLGIECAADNAPLLATLAALDDAPSRARADAERAFARAMEGDCHTALGAYAHLSDNGGDSAVRLHAFYAGDGDYHETTAAAATPAAAAAAAAAAIHRARGR